MPQARQNLFCPQCGSAKAIEQDNPDQPGGTRTFDCGETVTHALNGYHASYTCQTIPALMPKLEAALEAALNMAARAPMRFPVRRLLLAMMNGDGPKNMGKVNFRNMEDLRASGAVATVSMGDGQPHYRLTTFGHRLARKLREGEPR